MAQPVGGNKLAPGCRAISDVSLGQTWNALMLRIGPGLALLFWHFMFMCLDEIWVCALDSRYVSMYQETKPIEPWQITVVLSH